MTDQRTPPPESHYFLSVEDRIKINKWLTETVYPALIAKQKEANPKPDYVMQESWDMGYPYMGAIGGGEQYCFIPTSLGVILKVKHAGFDGELDLTDYMSW